MPLISTLGTLRQEYRCKFKVSLGYTMKLQKHTHTTHTQKAAEIVQIKVFASQFWRSELFSRACTKVEERPDPRTCPSTFTYALCHVPLTPTYPINMLIAILLLEGNNIFKYKSIVTDFLRELSDNLSHTNTSSSSHYCCSLL